MTPAPRPPERKPCNLHGQWRVESHLKLDKLLDKLLDDKVGLKVKLGLALKRPSRASIQDKLHKISSGLLVALYV